MAYSGNAGQYQPIYDNNYLAPQPQPPVNSRFSEQGYDSYSPYEDEAVRRLEEKDSMMKRRIRLLRFISRVIAVGLSIAVTVPMTMTLIKYLETRNSSHSGFNDTERPIWPENTNTTYTYVYFGVSVVSLLLNAIILLSYFQGVRKANYAATIGTVWTTIVILAHIGVWIAAVAIYRYGKRKVNDKWEDIWGWTCSKTADDIQPFVKQIRFSKYCNIQVSSSNLEMSSDVSDNNTRMLRITPDWSRSHRAC